jgi:hypothetical protein
MVVDHHEMCLPAMVVHDAKEGACSEVCPLLSLFWPIPVHEGRLSRSRELCATMSSDVNGVYFQGHLPMNVVETAGQLSQDPPESWDRRYTLDESGSIGPGTWVHIHHGLSERAHGAWHP